MSFAAEAHGFAAVEIHGDHEQFAVQRIEAVAGAMVLEGHIYNYRQAQKTAFRGIWTPQDDGSVIQHFDIYNVADEEWNVWFEGLYVRSEKAAD